MKNKFKYIIYAPSYNENSGGCIVLHKLCHILNELKIESYLFPAYIPKSSDYDAFLKNFLIALKRKYYNNLFFKVNKSFNTPILKKIPIESEKKNWVIIYPEIIAGNPLRMKNVVRWLLHQPGYFTNNVFYGKNELYFKFNSAINDFNIPGSELSSLNVEVLHYPEVYYNSGESNKKRKGTAYCLRKGSDKKIVHDINNSILIDDLSHCEIAKIFKKVKRFVSYDEYTAYSVFSVLCGCQSIVVPDKDKSIIEWYPDEESRWGISYGFSSEELSRADKTRNLLFERIKNQEINSIMSVKSMTLEIDIFFNK